MHDDGLAVGGPLGTQRGIVLAGVEIAIDEIGNDLDGALDIEFLERGFFQVMGDGSDAVGLLDGEFGDGQEAAIVADQSDVGAVERGNERQAPGSGHGAREQRAHRVRDGVMNVQQVEMLGFGDLHHFDGEGQRVGCVIEKRVIGNFDFVERDVFRAGIQPHRRSVTDEVNVVAARGELHAELGGHDSGAAIGGIAGDAYSHCRIRRIHGRGFFH